MMDTFGLPGVPALLFLDAHSHVRRVWSGAVLGWNAARFQREIARAEAAGRLTGRGARPR